MRWLVMMALASGCAGRPPSTSGDDDVDAPTATLGKRLSGKAIDYFDLVPTPDATITTDGIDPPKTATSIADGSFEIDDVPLGSSVVLTVAHPAYRTTRNPATAVVDGDVMKNIDVVGDEDLARQYQAVAITPAAGTGVLFAEIRDDLGAPLEGVPLTNITLVDAGNVQVAGIAGPFVFGASDLDPALTMATTVGGRSRVGILDIPPGVFTLRVSFINAAQMPITSTARVTATADGVVLALTGG